MITLLPWFGFFSTNLSFLCGGFSLPRLFLQLPYAPLHQKATYRLHSAEPWSQMYPPSWRAREPIVTKHNQFRRPTVVVLDCIPRKEGSQIHTVPSCHGQQEPPRWSRYYSWQERTSKQQLRGQTSAVAPIAGVVQIARARCRTWLR